MPQKELTSKSHSLNESTEFSDDRETMVKVNHVTMEFNMASEQLNSLKEYAIALIKRKLYFEKFIALKDISLEVKKGDVFGILGTNGSGKSTLLKIIAGVLEPTEGECIINGNIAPLIELGAGFDMELSARENIYLNGSLLGYSKKFIDEHFDEIVDFAEIDKFLDMPMKNYSSGMIARIAFAIATVIIPEILIVDEVLSVGDFLFQQKCENRINDLIENHGVTVLIVSHSNEQIERLCNKAIWIEKGDARITGSANEVCNAYKALSADKEFDAQTYDDILESIVQMRPITDISFQYSFLKNETPANTWFDIVNRYWTQKADKVVIAGSNKTDVAIASSLAGVLSCPVLMYSNNTLEKLIKYIFQHKPTEIMIIDSIDEIRNDLDASDFHWDCSLTEFKSESPSELSILVYEYLKRSHIELDTLYLADALDPASLLVISSMFHNEPGAIFIHQTDEQTDKMVLNALMESDASKLISVVDLDILKEVSTSSKIEVIKLCDFGSTPYNSISRFAFSENRQTSTMHSQIKVPLFLSPYSSCQWNEISLMGYYSGAVNSSLFLVDYTDLKCLSDILSFIHQNANYIDELIYVGSSSELNGVYNQLFLNALATKKGNNGA